MEGRGCVIAYLGFCVWGYAIGLLLLGIGILVRGNEIGIPNPLGLVVIIAAIVAMFFIKRFFSWFRELETSGFAAVAIINFILLLLLTLGLTAIFGPIWPIQFAPH